jgi:hypothetical protein
MPHCGANILGRGNAGIGAVTMGELKKKPAEENG